MPKFGAVLRTARKKSGKTLADLADALGVSVAYLSDVERENRPPLTKDRILEAARFLGVSNERLQEAAAVAKSGFRFDPDAHYSERALAVGAALTRKLPEMTEEEIEKLEHQFLRKGGG